MLHQRLQDDTIGIVRLALSHVLLMNDASFPWLILVPEREDVREVHELTSGERSILIEEIAAASKIMQRLCSPDKINIGALGNLVSQLHIHVIGRFRQDRSWPGPVWGSGPGNPYPAGELNIVSARFREAFQQQNEFHG